MTNLLEAALAGYSQPSHFHVDLSAKISKIEAKKGQEGRDSGQTRVVALVSDVWERVWDQLSVLDLARVARVCRAWRDAAASKTAARRKGIAAQVKPPGHVDMSR